VSASLDLFTRMAPFGFDDGATFSEDRVYRYHLWRGWGDREHRCVFVGVNPSDADERDNDQTITKCVGFAKRWAFGALDMLNPFALVSTDVTGLLRHPDPIGPENDKYLEHVLANASRIVWAWGKHPVRVRKLIRQRIESAGWFAVPRHCEVGTLGHNGDGSPRHPLMLPYATRFERML
jgi:hypothetical protein